MVRMGLLGDGCAAAVSHDGVVRSLTDDKAGGFSNITIALTPATSDTQWATLEVSETECQAIVLCTDGVSDDLENLEGFMAGFVEAHCALAQVTASAQTRQMLEEWPVPKHTDDKTIACLLRQEVTV